MEATRKLHLVTSMEHRHRSCRITDTAPPIDPRRIPHPPPRHHGPSLHYHLPNPLGAPPPIPPSRLPLPWQLSVSSMRGNTGSWGSWWLSRRPPKRSTSPHVPHISLSPLVTSLDTGDRNNFEHRDARDTSPST
jgi:hypothetical protein